MRIALYPGSFDPFHNGHLSVVDAIAPSVGELVIAVVANPSKSGLLPRPTRAALVAASVAHHGNVRVVEHVGRLVALAREVRADVLVRGAARDPTSEHRMAATNRALQGIETVFVSPDPRHRAVSSTLVRHLLETGHLDEVRSLVPPPVHEGLAALARPT